MKWKAILPNGQEVDTYGGSFSAAASNAMRHHPIKRLDERKEIIIIQPETKARKAERRRFVMKVCTFWLSDLNATPVEGERL